MATINDWLAREIHDRDLTPAELSRLTGLSQPVISRLLSGERKPSPATLQSLAKGLRVPVEEIYQQAGILPPTKNANDLLDARIIAMLNDPDLDQDDRDDILAMIQAKIDRKKRKSG